MAELRIPLDPLNPGQFFACCGLFELATNNGEARAYFEADEATPRRAHFIVHESANIRDVLQAVRDANPTPLADRGEDSTRPILLTINGKEVVLDWWLDFFGEGTTSLKCWAGQVTTRKLFDDLPPLIDPDCEPCRLMTAAAMTKSKLGIDPRSAWNALDFGFSPDAHNKDAATYPAVEVLGAIGLQGFRPYPDRRDNIAYHLWAAPLPLTVARLAAVDAWEGLPRCSYEFSIAKRGQSYKYFKLAKFIERTN